MAKKNGIKKTIREAGKNISNKEMAKIVKAAGGSTSKALDKISSVQKSLKEADKTAPSIGSKAANQLIKQAQSTPTGVYQLGSSKLAQAIQGMAGTPAGPMRQGQQPPGTPGSGLVPGGMVIRPSGRLATGPLKGKGTGKGTMPGPYDGAFNNGTEGPGGGGPGGLNLTQEELDKLIADGIQTGIDSYMSEYGLGDQQYDPYADLSTMLASAMAPYQSALSSQMDLMNQFAMPQQMEPMRMFGAGQNYNINSVRAAQRDRQRRSGYLRGNMGIGGGSTGAPGLSSGMSIGSALGTLGGVTV